MRLAQTAVASLRVPEGIPGEPCPPPRNRGRKVAKNEVAADTLLNHRAGKGLGEPEIAGLGFPNHICNVVAGSQAARGEVHWESQPRSRAGQWVSERN